MNAFIPLGNNLAVKASLNEMSDDVLVSAAKSGDAVAFVELSKRHSNKILRRAYRIVKNWQDAEDVLQESFIKAFVHLKNFEERSSFSSWFTRIAINNALMMVRKRRGYIEIPTDSINDDSGTRDHRWELRDLTESPAPRAPRHCSVETCRRSFNGGGCTSSRHLRASGQVEASACESGIAHITVSSNCVICRYRIKLPSRSRESNDIAGFRAHPSAKRKDHGVPHASRLVN